MYDKRKARYEVQTVSGFYFGALRFSAALDKVYTHMRSGSGQPLA